jgi:hypothetical protein
MLTYALYFKIRHGSSLSQCCGRPVDLRIVSRDGGTTCRSTRSPWLRSRRRTHEHPDLPEVYQGGVVQLHDNIRCFGNAFAGGFSHLLRGLFVCLGDFAVQLLRPGRVPQEAPMLPNSVSGLQEAVRFASTVRVVAKVVLCVDALIGAAQLKTSTLKSRFFFRLNEFGKN